jgi:hypothetical protein
MPHTRTCTHVRTYIHLPPLEAARLSGDLAPTPEPRDGRYAHWPLGPLRACHLTPVTRHDLARSRPRPRSRRRSRASARVGELPGEAPRACRDGGGGGVKPVRAPPVFQTAAAPARAATAPRRARSALRACRPPPSVPCVCPCLTSGDPPASRFAYRARTPLRPPQIRTHAASRARPPPTATTRTPAALLLLAAAFSRDSSGHTARRTAARTPASTHPLRQPLAARPAVR